MANETRNVFTTSTALTLTSMNSAPGVTSGDLWNSGLIATGPSAGLQFPGLQISFRLDWSAAPASGDSITFWLAEGDENATSEIWTAALVETEGVITSATTIERLVSGTPPVHRVVMQSANATTAIAGLFEVYDPSPHWQLVVRPAGGALAQTGNQIHYRYIEPQGQ